MTNNNIINIKENQHLRSGLSDIDYKHVDNSKVASFVAYKIGGETEIEELNNPWFVNAPSIADYIIEKDGIIELSYSTGLIDDDYDY